MISSKLCEFISLSLFGCTSMKKACGEEINCCELDQCRQWCPQSARRWLVDSGLSARSLLEQELGAS